MATTAMQLDLSVKDGGLLELLKAKNLSAAGIKLITSAEPDCLNITTLNDFATWWVIGSYEAELKDLVTALADTFEGIKTTQEKGQVTARLRQAWKEAHRITTSEPTPPPTVSEATGLTQAQLEAALAPEEKKSLDENWDDRHHLVPPAWLQGADALVNRTFREWRATLPTVPTASQVKSVIAALQPNERHEAPVGGSGGEGHPWLVWEREKKTRIDTVVDYY